MIKIKLTFFIKLTKFSDPYICNFCTFNKRYTLVFSVQCYQNLHCSTDKKNKLDFHLLFFAFGNP